MSTISLLFLVVRKAHEGEMCMCVWRCQNDVRG